MLKSLTDSQEQFQPRHFLTCRARNLGAIKEQNGINGDVISHFFQPSQRIAIHIAHGKTRRMSAQVNGFITFHKMYVCGI
jgi:hypothetical protein